MDVLLCNTFTAHALGIGFLDVFQDGTPLGDDVHGIHPPTASILIGTGAVWSMTP